jgi:GT2 family glycosyltransferase
MKLSVVISTRNRAHAIVECLDSVAAALANAAPLDAEIVVVDNGSTDNTAARIKAWENACTIPVQLLSEPRPGLARAHNRALRAARGDLFAFTDDDCQLSKDYVNQLLRHDAADTDLVLRGGRIELGDATDLPLTINTGNYLIRWNRKKNSARHECLIGRINGCNMTMRRALVERVGPFDEDFGPGGRFISGGDTDYIYRAYLADATLEYVPDMTVLHHHGRKTREDGKKLLRSYMKGNGALSARYLFKHPNLCRPFYWDCKNALREIITGTNTCLPNIGFSHKDKVAYSVQGAAAYFLARKKETAPLVGYTEGTHRRTLNR